MVDRNKFEVIFSSSQPLMSIKLSATSLLNVCCVEGGCEEGLREWMGGSCVCVCMCVGGGGLVDKQQKADLEWSIGFWVFDQQWSLKILNAMIPLQLFKDLKIQKKKKKKKDKRKTIRQLIFTKEKKLQEIKWRNEDTFRNDIHESKYKWY